MASVPPIGYARRFAVHGFQTDARQAGAVLEDAIPNRDPSSFYTHSSLVSGVTDKVASPTFFYDGRARIPLLVSNRSVISRK